MVMKRRTSRLMEAATTVRPKRMKTRERATYPGLVVRASPFWRRSSLSGGLKKKEEVEEQEYVIKFSITKYYGILLRYACHEFQTQFLIIKMVIWIIFTDVISQKTENKKF